MMSTKRIGWSAALLVLAMLAIALIHHWLERAPAQLDPAAGPLTVAVASGEVALDAAPSLVTSPASARSPEFGPALPAASAQASDPFSRLELLPADPIAKLAASRDLAVAYAKAEMEQLPPSEPDRGFARLYVDLEIARQQAIRSEVLADRVYHDDFSFGTVEREWFARRGTQMVQFDAHGVWAIVLLEDSQYPELVAARHKKTQAIEEIERLRLAFRERTKQSKGVPPR